MENNQNANPLHPFGENPFGEDFVKDDSFGYLGGQNGDGQEPEDEHGKDRVCPVCGAPMQETETYCMSCGMSVMPVFKKDYLESKAQKQRDFGPRDNAAGYGEGGNSYSGSGYGSSNYGESTYGGSSSMASGSVPASQNTKTNAIIITTIAVVALLIVGILAGLNGGGSTGRAAGGKYQTAYYKMTVKQDGQNVEDLYEITYKGDKVITMMETAILDVSALEQKEIDAALSYIQSAGSNYTKYSFVEYEAKQDGKKIMLIITYKDLDKKSNVNDLVAAGMVELDENKKNATYLSYSRTKKLLQQKGYTEYYK